jgi:hypothetical protein
MMVMAVPVSMSAMTTTAAWPVAHERNLLGRVRVLFIVVFGRSSHGAGRGLFLRVEAALLVVTFGSRGSVDVAHLLVGRRRLLVARGATTATTRAA